ncbi:CD99 antigen isoform X3 [Cyanistes caeruleus]|uniref:CD99 antigen isoform X3 n=1 Tax=Cyanistes caeruleus TaxID=156563 RepID=UPI000CDB6834|nr:CD99 antigen isoform X3 [Cyanistes caeruleus]
MRRWTLLLLPVLLAVLISVRGQDDFSLEDALLEGNTKKPPVTQKTPSSDPDDFDLLHALDSDDPKPQPPANPRDTDNPKRDRPKGSERKGPTPKTGQEEASPGAIAGIVSAVGAALIGTVSSFIAYQKKKLCFKQSADEENVNMESHRGAQSEPPVQRTLLEN